MAEAYVDGGCATCVCLSRPKDLFTAAVEAGREAEVQALLQRDIGLIKRRSLGARHSAWHLAAQCGHVRVLQALVDAVLHGHDVGAMMNSSLRRMLAMTSTPERLLHTLLRQGCRGGLTPLMLASQGGHAEAVAYLLSIGEATQRRCGLSFVAGPL